MKETNNLSLKTEKDGTPLYPSDPQSRAKIDELIEELQSIDFVFIAFTRILGVPAYGSGYFSENLISGDNFRLRSDGVQNSIYFP